MYVHIGVKVRTGMNRRDTLVEIDAGKDMRFYAKAASSSPLANYDVRNYSKSLARRRQNLMQMRLRIE